MTQTESYPVGTPMDAVDRTGPHIGGSDAPVIALGKVYDMTPTRLYLQKLGREPGFSGNKFTEVGNLLEPYVRECANEFLRMRFEPVAPWVPHPERPWMHASLDGRALGENGSGGTQLEIKTTGRIEEWGESWSDPDEAVPERVRIQNQHDLEVWDDSRAIVVVLNVAGFHEKVLENDQDPSFLRRLVNMLEKRYFEVWRDRPYIERLVEAELRFIRCIETETPPEEPGEDAARLLYPTSSTGTVAEASQEDVDALTALIEVQEALKLLGVREKELKGKLMTAMKGISVLSREGTDMVRWKNNKGFDEESFKADYPAVYEGYCTKFDGAAFTRDYDELRARYMREGMGPRVFTPTAAAKKALGSASRPDGATGGGS